MGQSDTNSRRSSKKDALKSLFDHIGQQIEQNNIDLNSDNQFSKATKINLQSDGQDIGLKDFYNVYVLVVDEDISENQNSTLAEVAEELADQFRKDEKVCKIRETYFIMDEFNSDENWILLKDRSETKKNIRINIEPLEFKEMGHFENALEIAEEIQDQYFMYDGFVIVQTWDNMDYLSSCLSFMMEDLCKPIIFTGGRIPLHEPNTDLIPNLLESCFIAGAFEIPEVCIFCNNILLRANRSVVYMPNSVHAFRSPNFKPLGLKNATLSIKWGLINKKPTGGVLRDFKINDDFSSNINHCYYVPDLTNDQIDAIFKDESVEAVLMEFFGAGNTPEDDSYLVKSMKDAIKRGIPVFFTSQCHKGAVSSLYASSAVGYGAIACEDLTVPSAIAKIGFLIKKVNFIVLTSLVY